MTKFAGVLVATSAPFTQSGKLDLDEYERHCQWLISQGVHGLVPNGSLGEYSSLTADERAAVVDKAVATAAAAPRDVLVVPGVAAGSTAFVQEWTEQAKRAGADGVMALPPPSYRATHAEIVSHYEAVAEVGLSVIAYNNPFDTGTDLKPPLLAEIAALDGVVGVKEFSGDVRRISEIREAAPTLEILCGSDDVALESLLMGATGWIAGFANALPAASVELYDLVSASKVDEARALYAALLPAFRWDAVPQFVQAVKLGQELAGRFGGPTRAPRLPLDDSTAAAVRDAMRLALGAPVSVGARA